MAVAAALSKLRGVSAAARLPPTVVYGSERDAARQPKAEYAASAVNSLERLSALDAVFSNLIEPLLLSDTLVERANTLKEQDEAVSRAVVIAALRLAPTITTITARHVIEWIVRGLEAGRLGSDAEIDALLIAALPFHANKLFPRLVRALLAPQHAGGHKRPKWAWLGKVIESRKPVARKFVELNASSECLRAAVQQMASSAVAGVPVHHLCSFLAPVLATRLMGENERTLALACIDALCLSHKKFLTLTGRRSKKQTSPEAVTEMNRVKMCMLVALSTAVAAKQLDNDTREALSLAAVGCLRWAHSSNNTKDVAVGCLIVCVGRAGMSFDVATKLDKYGGLPTLLYTLSDFAGVKQLHEQYLLRLKGQNTAPETSETLE